MRCRDRGHVGVVAQECRDSRKGVTLVRVGLGGGGPGLLGASLG